MHRRYRVQRVDDECAGAPRARPSGEAREVAKVADAPAVGAARRVQLQGPTPHSGLDGMRAEGGNDEWRCGPPVARNEPVVPEREVRGERLHVLDDRAVLEVEIRGVPQPIRRASVDDPHGRHRIGRPFVVRGRSHRGSQRGVRRPRGGMPGALAVPIAIGDAPRVDGHRGSLAPRMPALVEPVSTGPSPYTRRICRAR